VNVFNVSRVRTVAPWDIAQRSSSDPTRMRFDEWVRTAQAKGMEAYVTFWAGYRDDTTSTACIGSGRAKSCTLPTTQQFAEKEHRTRGITCAPYSATIRSVGSRAARPPGSLLITA
jgi:hypothetical protein